MEFTNLLNWVAGIAILIMVIIPLLRSVRDSVPDPAVEKPLSKTEKELQKLNQLENKSRRAHELSLIYSPGEKIWIGVALVSWMAIWLFFV